MKMFVRKILMTCVHGKNDFAKIENIKY